MEGPHAVYRNWIFCVGDDSFDDCLVNGASIRRRVSGILWHLAQSLQQDLPGWSGNVWRGLYRPVQRVPFVRLLLFQYAGTTVSGRRRGSGRNGPGQQQNEERSAGWLRTEVRTPLLDPRNYLTHSFSGTASRSGQVIVPV